MSTAIKLHCWVHRDDPGRIFSVELDSTKTVDDLKDAIKVKRQPAFQHIAAYTLDLWSVSIDFDAGLESNLGKLDFGDVRPLSPWMKLSSVFSDQPTGDCLNIVIKYPSTHPHRNLDSDPRQVLRLNCLVLGESRSRIFPVELASTKTVGDLKKAIKFEKGPTFQHIAADAVVLWKVSIPPHQTVCPNLDQLQVNLDDVTSLLPIDGLSEVFSESLAPKHIHVIVKSPTLDDVGTLRAQFLEGTPAKPVSVGGEATIPVTLLHPIFGQFIDDRENYKPTAQDYSLTLELWPAMADFYPNEDDRRASRVREIFAKHGIHLVQTKIEGTMFETDGDISHGGFRYVLAEIKDEIGSSGPDPYAQAILHYLESTRKQAPAMRGSVLPCLIVVIIGPYMGFVGAAWDVRPVFQVLSVMLRFDFHVSDTDSQETIACHLGAFKKAIHGLENYYRPGPLVTSRASHQPSSHSQIFPYQIDFTSIADSKRHRIEYVSQPIADKLLFFGKLSDGGHAVCIKFTRHYSREAHSFCSSIRAAPELLGFELMVGGWFMVVMDLIGSNYVKFHESSRNPKILDDLRDILSRLHGAGFVHGDIRNTNIMVLEGGERLMLVDFDWAGKVGEVRYPINVYREGVWRPDGASGGELITAEHDIQMLQHLL